MKEALDPTLIIVIQAGLAILMLFFGFILNSLRASMDRVALDLKALNDAVLGKYVTIETAERKWEYQRTIDHELRGLIHNVQLKVQAIEVKLKDDNK